MGDEALDARAVDLGAVKRAADAWCAAQGLTPAERDVVFFWATLPRPSLDAVARARGVLRSTVKKQAYELLSKTGDSSCAFMAVRFWREVYGPQKAASPEGPGGVAESELVVSSPRSGDA